MQDLVISLGLILFLLGLLTGLTVPSFKNPRMGRREPAVRYMSSSKILSDGLIALVHDRPSSLPQTVRSPRTLASGHVAS
jgi:hypothetical protein